MVPLIIMTIEDAGEREFMEKLYLTYNRLMFSTINKITKDSWITDDVLQSVLLKLIDKIPLLQTLSRNKLVNYIITTSRNTALTYLQQRARDAELPFDESFDSIPNQDSDLESELLRQVRKENLSLAWNALDARSRRILELKYFMERDDKSIASELGIQPGSVRMLLTRARKNFACKIQEIETDCPV